ncbi:YaaC family protein [Fictibacillus sp. KIGAM418]|uniref:YaaC family protein n=1 Tax=Fictibacillus marinisediminis TaxID=2878389 RepID=A0A9X1XF38_9BACL|nr:YaaC family protein [Fictibacillus marinisediminis]MCK6259506.1 YaaC family protein [Fictibacillus marinisediminis]
MLGLSYIGMYENYSKIQSDNPLRDIWDMILKNSDINFLSQRWEEKDMDSYTYVSTSITQAYEYFRASKVSSLKTRPLLLYYSFLNLTKAILFLKSNKKPTNYHGLCKEKIEKKIEKSEDFLLFSAEVNNGVFYQLGELIGTQPAIKTIFTLEDLFNNIVELSAVFSEYFNKNHNFICPKVDGYSNGVLKLTFNKEVLSVNEITKTNLEETFIKEFSLEEDEQNIIFYNKLNKQGEEYNIFHKQATEILEKYFSFSVYDDKRYYFNCNNSTKINGALACYGIMYLLSSIVRYKPEHIYKLLDDKTISINWFLGKICDTLERIYPNMMLNILFEEKIKFSSSDF